MDPRYTGEMLKHLEKQSELLMDSYRSMSHEVEEEMLMRKFYEIMSAHGLTKQTQDRSNVPDNGENADCKVIVVATNNSQHYIIKHKDHVTKGKRCQTNSKLDNLEMICYQGTKLVY
ncbi:hypothetical protein F2P56_013820 [Juglans regia]|uniref:Uncharacterized protein n=1 Tax=Juglans regia TaxID=51240 RepID=A0A833XC49_JUGRE|nr:hypothetical protein F2P56_013820 [Juglans regia]